MTSKTLLKLSLSLAAIMVQAACGTGTAGSQSPAEPGTTAVVKRAAATDTVILPEGTLLTVRTTSTLSTNTQESGQTFTAHLDQALLKDGREVAPKGAEVTGKILDADKGGRVKGLATMTLQLTTIDLGGQSIHISTSSVTQSAGTTKRKDAAEIGIGAGVGAAIGAIAGGGQRRRHRCGCRWSCRYGAWYLRPAVRLP